MGNRNKYGKPKIRIINQRKVSQFLKEIGFTTSVITQEWRHLTAFGKFKDKAAVFKLASTKATSVHTKNEFCWNNIVEKLSTSRNLSFSVPKNYTSGNYKSLFYFIMEKFPGDPLIKRGETFSVKKVPLNLIARTTSNIFSLTFCKSEKEYINKLYKKKKTKLDIKEKLMESSIEWASQVPLNLNSYLKIIEESKNLRTAPAHGDFVLRQMFKLSNTKLGIIDGELSGLEGPRYYDVAQFYLRTRVDHGARMLANRYLVLLNRLLPRKDKSTFWYELKPVLIQRYIGNLWGAKNHPDQLEKLEALGKEILANKILKK